MHLGMSGSFRVGKDAKPGVYYHERSKSTAHDHVVFHMSNGATVTFNDPRRFGSMKLVARAKLDQEPLLRSLGPEPLGNEFDAAMLARACAGKKTSLKAALQRPARGRGPRQHLCLRGAVPRRAVAQAASLDDRRPQRPSRTRARWRWSMPSRRCSRTPSRPAAPRCATIAAPTARSAISSTISASMTARAQPCPELQGQEEKTIKRIVQTGRSTFYCPSCQK